ncbi:glycosyltransferase [Promicromonospora sukumoe]|uniref:glycosyltransferase n=1 Tax=Promicromonospora sukumoe TaxID=88382 RepID=UPI000366E504|nr:glycosyltransferase [Promicromonospora sukumoe]
MVVPTLGHPRLGLLVASVRETTARGQDPLDVLVIDDRPFGARGPNQALDLGPGPVPGVRVVRSGGRGPAAARNVGWRSTRTEWVVFLDDDVVVSALWAAALVRDVTAAGPDVAALQGHLRIPLPDDPRLAGPEHARWATTDMVFRRAALERVHGFDERSRTADGGDADLALRLRTAGWQLGRGTRSVERSVRPARDLAGLRTETHNADDALLRARHGGSWRARAEVGPGRLPWHVAAVAAGLTALTAGVAAAVLDAREPHVAHAVAALAGLVWVALTAGLAWERAPRRTVLTSALAPFAAVAYRARGAWRWRQGLGRTVPARPLPVRAVLFAKGALVRVVPDDAGPDVVEPLPGARRVLRGLRADGMFVGLVWDRTDAGCGHLTVAQADTVGREMRRVLGRVDTWQLCTHARTEGCTCREPEAGLVLRAAAELGVLPAECAVVGDVRDGIGAAVTAGARSIVLPTDAGWA